MAKRDTVLAIALALTAGALIAVRRSSGAIERVLSASAITVLLNFFGYLKSKLKITGGDVASVWNGYELEKQSDGSLRVSQTKQIMETLKKAKRGMWPKSLGHSPSLWGLQWRDLGILPYGS